MSSILITGGTGSFGRAFVHRLLHGAPDYDRICIYSRGEHAQAAMREEMADDPRLRWFIGDVRDGPRLRRAMAGCEHVVHAAALKRIEVGHYCPDEVIKTNILGAMNAVEAAADIGVRKFVYLSSDKAYCPVSAYGTSKAAAESLVLAANNMNEGGGTRFAVTRYGNVAGSAGSVIPKWRTSIPGASVPITDPDCTRFWMTMDEAVQLVLETLRFMKGGELRIPTLPAYRLGDLAEAMDRPTHTIGLPAWEKRHESMAEGMSSDAARRMTVEELREALKNV